MDDIEVKVDESQANVEVILISKEDLPTGVPDPRLEVAMLKPEPSESPESFAKRRYDLFYAKINEVNNNPLGIKPHIGIPFDKLPKKIKAEWVNGARQAIERMGGSTYTNPHAKKITTRAELLQRRKRRVPR